jgi:hypothetical protein
VASEHRARSSHLQTPRADPLEDGGDPRSSGEEDAEVTHDEYIEQLEAISEARLPATETLECQIAFSFIEYLQRFKNYETRTAQRLILDILKKHNVRILREVPPHPDEPLAWINQMNDELKRRGWIPESKEAR